MSIIEPDQQRTIGPEPVAPPTPPTPPPAAPSTPAEPETFDRAYVEDLRKENAKWRTQLREYEAEFDGIDPEERKALAEFARLSVRAQSGDEEALKTLGEMLGEETAPAVQEQAPVYDEAYFRRIAAEEASRIAAEQQRYSDEQRGIAEIVRQAEALGYKQGSEDYVLLMRAANSVDPTEHSDLLAEGDRLVKAYKQSIIEGYLAEKEGRTVTSPVLTPAGSPPSQSAQPWNDQMSAAEKWQAVRNSVHERLTGGR